MAAHAHISRDHELAGQPAEVALPLLLEEHGGRLFKLSLKLCGHPQDAEDLVQEIFLIALRKWHQFNGKARPTTWLYTIAARACSRRRRKRTQCGKDPRNPWSRPCLSW